MGPGNKDRWKTALKEKRREKKHESRDGISERDEKCSNQSHQLVRKTVCGLARSTK